MGNQQVHELTVGESRLVTSVMAERQRLLQQSSIAIAELSKLIGARAGLPANAKLLEFRPTDGRGWVMVYELAGAPPGEAASK
jgi:hypothetical protein